MKRGGSLAVLAMLIVSAVSRADTPCPGFIAVGPQTGAPADGAASLVVGLQLDPTVTPPLQNVQIVLDQGEGFSIDQTTLDLTPDTKRPVHVLVRGQNPGLVRLTGHPTSALPAGAPRGCLTVDYPVDVGFQNAVMLQANGENAGAFSRSSEGAPGTSLDPKQPQHLRMSLVTRQDHRALNFDYSFTVQLEARGALLSLDGSKWADNLSTSTQQGVIPILLVNPIRFAGPGSLWVRLGDGSSRSTALATETFTFVTHPALPYRLLIAVLGGLAYSLVTALADKKTDLKAQRPVAQVVTGAVLGLIAGAMTEAGWLPVTIAKSNSWGYALVGLFFASLGLDGVIERLRARFSPKPAGGR